jgi:hypothetical protein
MTTKKERRRYEMTDAQRRAWLDQAAAKERDGRGTRPKPTPEQVRQVARVLREAYKGS